MGPLVLVSTRVPGLLNLLVIPVPSIHNTGSALFRPTLDRLTGATLIRTGLSALGVCSELCLLRF